jgi:hypothetical protein
MATKQEDKTLSILAHVLGIFSWFIGPLVIYLSTKDEKAKKHAAKALNWQISVAIYYAALFIFLIISFILVVIFIGLLFVVICYLAMFALGILNLVFCILAAVKANQDELWDYPLSIPFVKV